MHSFCSLFSPFSLLFLFFSSLRVFALFGRCSLFLPLSFLSLSSFPLTVFSLMRFFYQLSRAHIIQTSLLCKHLATILLHSYIITLARRLPPDLLCLHTVFLLYSQSSTRVSIAASIGSNRNRPGFCIRHVHTMEAALRLEPPSDFSMRVPLYDRSFR